MRDQSKASEPLMPLIGVKSFNVPTLTAAEYIDLVDFTGREIHALLVNWKKLIYKAKKMAQRTLFGIGLARILSIAAIVLEGNT